MSAAQSSCSEQHRVSILHMWDFNRANISEGCIDSVRLRSTP